MRSPTPPNFKSDPKALITWLKHNILFAKNPIADSDSGVVLMTIKPEEGRLGPGYEPIAKRYLEEGGKDKYGSAGVYRLQCNKLSDPDSIPKNSFKAFVCNYKLGEVHSVDLDDTADFCFTATMNGCTFGIGKDVGGIRRVSHANYQSGKEPRDDHVLINGIKRENKRKQREMIQKEHEANGVGIDMKGVSLLEPSEYYIEVGRPTSATTFGIRTDDGWKFFTQIYKALEKTQDGITPEYLLVDVISIPTPENLTYKAEKKYRDSFKKAKSKGKRDRVGQEGATQAVVSSVELNLPYEPMKSEKKHCGNKQKKTAPARARDLLEDRHDIAIHKKAMRRIPHVEYWV